jgi:hypothetical protein
LWREKVMEKKSTEKEGVFEFDVVSMKVFSH